MFSIPVTWRSLVMWWTLPIYSWSYHWAYVFVQVSWFWKRYSMKLNGVYTIDENLLFQSMGKVSLYDLLLPVAGVPFPFIILFALFYIAQTLHSNLLELNDEIYQSKWYRYPDNVKQCMRLMLRQSQRPVYLSVYGAILLDLESFLRVSNMSASIEYHLIRFLLQLIKGIFSTFTILRSFE